MSEIHADLYYVAVFLDSRSRAALLDWARPQFEVVAADHVTLAAGLTAEQAEIFRSKVDHVKITVTGFVQGPDIEAVVVEVTGAPKKETGFHHITISYKKGTAPASANWLTGTSIPIEPMAMTLGSIKVVPHTKRPVSPDTEISN